MKNGKIITALASFGMSGQVFHAPFIKSNPNFEFYSVLERTKNEAVKIYPNVKTVRTYEALLTDEYVDLVIVNTPSYLHFEMCKAALLAGKNVVVEKPFVANSTEGQELIDLAKQLGLILTVYHNKRLEGDFLTVKQLLASKKLGSIKAVEINSFRFKPEIGVKKWKEEEFPGAGLLYDIGSHLIDQVLQLFGKPIVIKSELSIKREGGKVVDAFLIFFEYAGYSVQLKADMMEQNEMPSFVLIGDKKHFVKYGKDPQEEMLRLNPLSVKGIGAYSQTGELKGVDSGDVEQVTILNGRYEDFYKNLHQVLLGEATLLVDPNDALEVIKIIESL